MKIAVAGTLWLNTPPKNYGGTESVIANLVNGLSSKGHDVTFFGPATAKLNAKIVPTVTLPLREQHVSWANNTHTLYHFTKLFDHAKEFDIVHVHLNKSQDYVALPFSVYKNVPTLFTIHFRLPSNSYNSDRYQILYAYKYLPYSSISVSQQIPDLNFIANIYNSIDVSSYPFSSTANDYVVWLGKIARFKGTKEAILAAKQAHKTIYILGAIEHGDPEKLSYYENEIVPLIDGKHVILYESIGLPQKAALLGKAQALLNPIKWEEPFGLVMIEAQSCGTPVIAYKRGASPEVVKEGKTGFLVSSVDEMVKAMKKIDTIKRKNCRTFIEENFSVEKMTEGYLAAYETVIHHWPEYYQSQIKRI